MHTLLLSSAFIITCDAITEYQTNVAGNSNGGLGSFWNQAWKAMDLPEQIPLERWPINRVYSPDVSINKMYVRFAGFLPHGDCFDAAAFRCASKACTGQLI